MSLADVHDQALQHTGRLVAAVASDQWILSTPDTEWDVRDLVSHIVLENKWVEPLVDGNSPDDVDDQFDDDPLGNDPIAAYETSARSAGAAFRRVGVMDRDIKVSFGEISGREFANQRLLDLVVHGWDLATATAQDAAIPTALLDPVYEFVNSQRQALQASGVFADALPVSDSADKQTKLLAALGRRA